MENYRFFSSRKLYVKKLQIHIVKALKVSKYGKVKSLQHLLTTSFYTKSLTVKRVTENQGKKTSGVYGELWLTPNAKYDAIGNLNLREYKPKPLKRVYIPKKRPLSIPTMTDRAIQTLYFNQLQKQRQALILMGLEQKMYARRYWEALYIA